MNDSAISDSKVILDFFLPETFYARSFMPSARNTTLVSRFLQTQLNGEVKHPVLPHQLLAKQAAKGVLALLSSHLMELVLVSAAEN
jgi:hypothetical protein